MEDGLFIIYINATKSILSHLKEILCPLMLINGLYAISDKMKKRGCENHVSQLTVISKKQERS